MTATKVETMNSTEFLDRLNALIAEAWAAGLRQDEIETEIATALDLFRDDHPDDGE